MLDPTLPAPSAETIVPDNMLRDFARGSQSGDGFLDTVEVALLNMVLPEIAGELLAYRLAQRASKAVAA